MNDKVKECETALSVIQSGLTWRLQPLDISIDKVFKESLSDKYLGYWISKYNIKVSKSAIIEWIYEFDIRILLWLMKWYLILLNIQVLVTHEMEVKMTNLDDTKI